MGRIIYTAPDLTVVYNLKTGQITRIVKRENAVLIEGQHAELNIGGLEDAELLYENIVRELIGTNSLASLIYKQENKRIYYDP